MSTLNLSQEHTRFIPLTLDSQGNSIEVLYYDSHAPLDAVFECAMARLLAVSGLLAILYEFKNPPADALTAIASISSLLLADANTLLQRFNPIAID